MLFNSFRFALFLPAVVAGLWLLPVRFRRLWLLAASYTFYGAWDARFLVLIFLSTFVDYLVGRRLDNSSDRHRKALLVGSVAFNLGVLGFFKYWGFFVDSAGALAESLGLTFTPLVLEIVLPVGISFYTFQSMAYVIDVYRQRIPSEASFLTFALYVAFFPQLVAGPIERAKTLLPQLNQLAPSWTWARMGSGLTLIGVGLFKKVAIADSVAPFVNGVFGDASVRPWPDLAAAAIGFGLQIYGDFSGYTDIARGTARLMGVELMENFRQPYFSSSVTEFWRRWHISLSTWLRDYLYIPLGGNRSRSALTYRNLLLTMFLGGLWHGAAWTFVLWGFLHGCYLIVERLAEVTIDPPAESRRPLRVGLTLLLVSVAWIVFRSDSLLGAWEYIQRLLTLQGGETDLFGIGVVAVAAALTYIVDSRQRLFGENPVSHLRPVYRGMAYGGALAFVLVFASPLSIPFIYFQF